MANARYADANGRVPEDPAVTRSLTRLPTIVVRPDGAPGGAPGGAPEGASATPADVKRIVAGLGILATTMTAPEVAALVPVMLAGLGAAVVMAVVVELLLRLAERPAVPAIPDAPPGPLPPSPGLEPPVVPPQRPVDGPQPVPPVDTPGHAGPAFGTRPRLERAFGDGPEYLRSMIGKSLHTSRSCRPRPLRLRRGWRRWPCAACAARIFCR